MCVQMGLTLPPRLLSFTDYLLMQVYSHIFKSRMHWNNVENLMLITHLCIQTLCGTASLRRGLHLIGYVRAGILWSVLIIIINFCAAFWGYAAQKRLHVSVELRQIWRWKFKLSLFSTPSLTILGQWLLNFQVQLREYRWRHSNIRPQRRLNGVMEDFFKASGPHLACIRVPHWCPDIQSIYTC